MFDHRAMLCSIRVINSRCDILLDRSVVTHGFSRCGHNKLQYTVFCLLTVYLVVSSLYRSDDSISHACVTCQVRLLCYMYCFMQSVYCLNSLSTTSRHRGRCAEKWQEHVRAAVSKSRSSLQRAEMIYYVTLSPPGSWIQSRHSGAGSKLIGHLRSPAVMPVRRACAYVERRSGLLDVAYRRANIRHEPLPFWHEPLTFDVLDRSTFWTATPAPRTLLRAWLDRVEVSTGSTDTTKFVDRGQSTSRQVNGQEFHPKEL